MQLHYEVQNQKLKKMLLKKANDLHISLETLIWNYINRGLMDDNINEDIFEEVHSESFLNEVNEALDVN
jgi:hypothetical protein